MKLLSQSILTELSFQEIVETYLVEISEEHKVVAIYNKVSSGRYYQPLRKVFFYSTETLELINVIYELDYDVDRIVFHAEESLVLLSTKTNEQHLAKIEGEVVVYNFISNSAKAYRKVTPWLYKERFQEHYLKIKFSKEPVPDLSTWIVDNPRYAYYKEVIEHIQQARRDAPKTNQRSRYSGRRYRRFRSNDLGYKHFLFEVETDTGVLTFSRKHLGGFQKHGKVKTLCDLVFPTDLQLETLAQRAGKPYKSMYRKQTFSLVAVDENRIAVGFYGGLIQLIDLTDYSAVEIQLPANVSCKEMIYFSSCNTLLVNGLTRERKDHRISHILFKVDLDTLTYDEILEGSFNIRAANDNYALVCYTRNDPRRPNETQTCVIISNKFEFINDFAPGGNVYIKIGLDPDSNLNQPLFYLANSKKPNGYEYCELIEADPTSGKHSVVLGFYKDTYQIHSFGIKVDDFFVFSGNRPSYIDAPAIFAFQEKEGLVWEQYIDGKIWGVTLINGLQKLIAVISANWRLYFIRATDGAIIEEQNLNWIKNYRRLLSFEGIGNNLVLGFNDGTLELITIES